MNYCDIYSSSNPIMMTKIDNITSKTAFLKRGEAEYRIIKPRPLIFRTNMKHTISTIFSDNLKINIICLYFYTLGSLR